VRSIASIENGSSNLRPKIMCVSAAWRMENWRQQQLILHSIRR
jgi:hypothetical protein